MNRIRFNFADFLREQDINWHSPDLSAVILSNQKDYESLLIRGYLSDEKNQYGKGKTRIAIKETNHG